MAKRSRLTESSDETEVSQLIAGDSVFTIPYFQRPYKWKTEKLKQLTHDILNVIDESDSHFLGAIIIHGRRNNPADPSVYEIIDGQQRITTIVLFLCAVIKTLCAEKEYSEAAALFLKFLVINRETKLPSNIKLHPCKEDRVQINDVFSSLMSSNSFVEKLGGFELKLLPPTGKKRGILKNNFNYALRFMKAQVETEGIERLHAIYGAILDLMSVVQINVSDPTNGPKIFDGLNSRQEPMTIGDLVRNEIFSRVSSETPKVIDDIDEHKWQPFYKKFQQGSKNLFDSYFFPFGLIQNPNLKKSEVYNYLRDSWEKSEKPQDIIKRLAVYQNAFIDISCGSNIQNHEQAVAVQFGNLTALGLPSSTWPFLIPLSNSIRDKKVTRKNGLETLKLVESFLVRRAVCGHEPTGLHAVFKRLWNDCKGKPTLKAIESAIRKHKTVVWPDDSDFKDAIINRPLYGSTITPYLLSQYDISLKGDQPQIIPWIEHVLPETLTEGWSQDFTPDQHEKLKDTLANLIPLTDKMNRSVSNKAYTHKRSKYKADSSFKSARQFGEKYKSWKPENLKRRADMLAKWAVMRWQ